MFKSSIFLKTVILSVFLVSFNGVSFAQLEEVDILKKNSLKISPTAFFVSTFALSYERYIGESMTFQLTGGLMASSKDAQDGTYYNGSPYSLDESRAYGWLAEGMFKYYFLKGQSAMSGLYAAPYFRYSKNNFDINTLNTNGIATPLSFKYHIESFGGGGVFGFQWVINNAFVMDMFVGGGLQICDDTSPATYGNDDTVFWVLEDQNTTGIVPKGGLRVGFVF